MFTGIIVFLESKVQVTLRNRLNRMRYNVRLDVCLSNACMPEFRTFYDGHSPGSTASHGCLAPNQNGAKFDGTCWRAAVVICSVICSQEIPD
jgi:hypothetical protein